jgi:hypothetical protein
MENQNNVSFRYQQNRFSQRKREEYHEKKKRVAGIPTPSYSMQPGSLTGHKTSMIRSSKAIPLEVGWEKHPVIPEVAIPSCRFAAEVGHDPCDHQDLDLETAQDCFQVGVVKSRIAVLEYRFFAGQRR